MTTATFILCWKCCESRHAGTTFWLGVKITRITFRRLPL